MKHLLIPIFAAVTTFTLNAQILQPEQLRKIDAKLQSVLLQSFPEKFVTNYTALPAEPALDVTDKGESRFGTVIRTVNPADVEALGIHVNSRLPGFVTARVTAEQLLQLAQLHSVRRITPGEVYYPTNDIAKGAIGADLLNGGYINTTSYKGNGVLLCVIDTGIDFKHLDFRDPNDTTQSRIKYIWDQTLTPTGGESSPSGFSYGVEYTETQIENELDGTPAGFVRETDSNGHGTHVTGSAAGNGNAYASGKYAGMAPQSTIIFIKAGNGSFPTTNLIDALSYAAAKATALGMPMVINMSLGGHANSHDGTRDLDVAVDNFTGTGRVACISAGNEGASNIHFSGTVPASGSTTVTFTLPTYTATSGANNDYFAADIWFDNNTGVNASIATPNAYSASQASESEGTTQTNDGTVYLYNFEEAANSDREVYLYVYDGNATYKPATGTWTLTLTNATASAVAFHGWLFGKTMSATVTGGNSTYTIGSPGTANNAITVGSFSTRWFWTASNGSTYFGGSPILNDDRSSFSSIGPRRDGVQKPDILSPGDRIISSTSTAASIAASSKVAGNKHHINQGTSMASPVLAGAAALLLQQNSSLTYSQVRTYLRNNADVDSYTGAVPNYYYGYGKLNIFKAMVNSISGSYPTSREIISYDTWSSYSSTALTNTQKAAVKFTPSISGSVTGLFFHFSGSHNVTGAMYGEIWTDNSGLPGSKLGTTCSLANGQLLGGGWNFIDMTGSGVSVTSGANYHAVVYFTSGSSTSFHTDNGSISNRSSTFNGSSWSAFTLGDIRLRPVVTVANSLLPVELTTFSAKRTGRNMVLQWNTAMEKNNFGFGVERCYLAAGERTAWQEIGFIRGGNNSNTPRAYSFLDETVPVAAAVFYRLRQIDNDGSVKYLKEIAAEGIVPAVYSLGNAYPNPFNPETIIRFSTGAEGMTVVKVFDALGREVKTLLQQRLQPGNYSVDFNGAGLPSGTYICTMTSGTFSASTKLLLVK